MRLSWRNALILPDRISDSSGYGTSVAERMIHSHRCALLLRPKLSAELDAHALRTARQDFDQETCLVTAGRVRLTRWQVDADANYDPTELADCVDVAALFLQRNTVTNEQFQAFLDQGGYQNESLWQAAVWPCVNDFVDRSGSLGPRFWSNGKHDPDAADHPVVGVSWFEADAYARWIGMRLPSDAEWVRAACSPIESDESVIQRKYPWGDAFSSQRLNLWSSGVGGTVSVDAYPEGDSSGGVRQMIGNVWEWTSSKLSLWNGQAPLELVEPLKSLRGGAFDSYLDNRATCQCRSADRPTARRHNIGFRCAVSVCDLVEIPGSLSGPPQSTEPSESLR